MLAGDLLRIEQEGEFAHLIFDAKGASVNKFDIDTLKALEKAVRILEQSTSIKGIVVLSKKPTFVVGADIREFNTLFKGEWDAMVKRLEWTNQIFRSLEVLPIPTVAAINGAAMGGGFEVALACDMRVMAYKALVGLPEVTLGLHPGFGGSVRLPRIAQATVAMDWMLDGRPRDAKSALFDNAIDAVVKNDDLIETAHEFLNKAISGKIHYKKRRERKSTAITTTPEKIAEHLQSYRAKFNPKPDQHIAAKALLTQFENSFSLHYEDAVQLEIESFCRLGQTPQSRALVGVFENEQYVKRIAKKRAANGKNIEKIGVVGAGIMGSGIAAQSALSGLEVALVDTNEQILDNAFQKMKAQWDRIIKKRSLDVSSSELAERVTLNGQLNDVDIVVEAVTENAKTKISVLNSIAEAKRRDALLASNTSTLSIDALANMLGDGEHFIGMHFFNPVLQMPLVEVVRGKKTKNDAIDSVFTLAGRMSKTPILINDCVGFFVNRVLFPYFAGFNQLVKDGADIARIDNAMETFGWPMGPAKLLDVIGLDTATFADEVLASAYPDRMAHDGTSIMEFIFGKGRLGVKSQAGFYEYEAAKPLPRSNPNNVARDFREKNTQFKQQEIVDRMMLPMCIEVARCLDEGVVASPAEADMAVLLGLGFPRYRGGIARYMDEIGMNDVIKRAREYEHLGARYQPIKAMEDMAASSKSYYS